MHCPATLRWDGVGEEQRGAGEAGGGQRAVRAARGGQREGGAARKSLLPRARARQVHRPAARGGDSAGEEQREEEGPGGVQRRRAARNTTRSVQRPPILSESILRQLPLFVRHVSSALCHSSLGVAYACPECGAGEEERAPWPCIISGGSLVPCCLFRLTSKTSLQST